MPIGGSAISGMTRYGSSAAVRELKRHLLPQYSGALESNFLGADQLYQAASRLAHLNWGKPLYRQFRREALQYSRRADGWFLPSIKRLGVTGFLERQVQDLGELQSTLRRTGLLTTSDLECLQLRLKFMEAWLHHASSPRLMNPKNHRASRLFSIAIGQVESLKLTAEEQAATLELKRRLLRAAHRTAENAHAPHSDFHVGAAVSTERGIFGGCNVESDSYGLTQCAERLAIGHAVARGARRIQAIGLVTPDNKPGAPLNLRMPCGACRQVMSEHLPQDAWVFIDGVGDFRMRQLLPLPFKLS